MKSQKSKKAIVTKTKILRIPKQKLAKGSTFANRYQIIEKLGRGGMGEVYRAFDKKVEEEVALKFLNPEIASDQNTIERFKNELKLARKISHKNVCSMYDLNEEEGTHYITMEYVAGTEDWQVSREKSNQHSPTDWQRTI
jgi:serine/threonine protein kinase